MTLIPLAINDDGVFPWAARIGAYDDGAFIYFPPVLAPTPPTPSVVAEILIGSEVVWSSSASVSQQQLSFDVRNFIGEHTITFRIRAT